jgi:hypothetical protein
LRALMTRLNTRAPPIRVCQPLLNSNTQDLHTSSTCSHTTSNNFLTSNSRVIQGSAHQAQDVAQLPCRAPTSLLMTLSTCPLQGRAHGYLEAFACSGLHLTMRCLCVLLMTS